MKKVFRATVEIEMFVVAEDEDEAADIARDNVGEETWNLSAHDFSVDEPNPEYYRTAVDLPWGDNPDDKTVGEFMEERLAAAAEEEERKRIEANQLKLFPVGGAQ
jgi:hypothetical protein